VRKNRPFARKLGWVKSPEAAKARTLARAAGTFFHGLNLTPIEHLILPVCRLTDPEFTMRKRNLTVEFLVNNSEFSASPNQRAKVAKLAARMHAFRKRILPARDKLISHNDLGAALGRKSLGGAPIVAWQQICTTSYRSFSRDMSANRSLASAGLLTPTCSSKPQRKQLFPRRARRRNSNLQG
jgi:hypothetical protein